MSTILKRCLIALTTMIAAGALLACPPDDEDPDEIEPSITVEDQTLEFEEADTVTIDEATIDHDGFAVVYDDDDGQPGEIMGASEMIEEGTSTDIEVELDRNAEDEERMWATLHYDALDEGAFQFDVPDKQPQAIDFDGDRVQDDFVVTVEDEPVEPVDELNLVIDDQTVDVDDADEVTVTEATIDDEGYVVIYEEEDDEIGDFLGASELLDDETREDFTVELDEALGLDDHDLWGRLHYNETDDEFDEQDDPPALDEDEQEVTDDFVYTVEEDVDPDPDPDEASISVSDQVLDVDDGDLSTIVVVDEVVMLEDGFVAVHLGDCDDPGTVFGYESVDEGETTDIDVELGEPAADQGTSRNFCARLYTDEDDDGVLDPDTDEAVVDADEEIVDQTFNVEVVEGTAAIRVTLGDDDQPDRYTVDNVEPTLFDGDFADQENNGAVVFELREQWRYEFDNTVADEDAFEFINDEDEVLLSQDTDAPLEDVDTVDWVEEDDVFWFTVSEDFYSETDALDDEGLAGTNVVDAYWSADSPNMRGPVQYHGLE